MTTPRPLLTSTALLGAVLLLLLSLPAAASGAPEAPARGHAVPRDPASIATPSWIWPVDADRSVTSAFRAPEHDYGPGHRGMDISAAIGMAVRAPADGVIAFRGVVVDRPLVTIDHGDGLVSTLEPIASALDVGEVVSAGEPIGEVASGGHSLPGTMHVGVRANGTYIDPLPLFGPPPRAVLLPCCRAQARRESALTQRAPPGLAVSRAGFPQARGWASR